MTKLVLMGPNTQDEYRKLYSASDAVRYIVFNETSRTDFVLSDNHDDDQIDKLLRNEHGDMIDINLTDIDLSYLENCLLLKRFFLNFPGFLNSLDLTPLENLQDLREVELVIHWNKGENLMGIDRLKQIKKLEYVPSWVRNTPDHKRRFDLEQFAGLKLDELFLSFPDRETDIAPLSEITTLQTLTLQSLKLQESNLHTIAKLQNLRQLKALHVVLDKLDLAPLENCKNLQHVRFKALRVKELDLEALSNCPSITSVQLEGCYIDKVKSKKLKKKGVDVKIWGLSRYDHSIVTRTGR
ncbi:MAG: hypothetical protein ACW99U_15115 [Candidatus Thorarchaeota archaeon]|jgi:hypothetical protein